MINSLFIKRNLNIYTYQRVAESNGLPGVAMSNVNKTMLLGVWKSASSTKLLNAPQKVLVTYVQSLFEFKDNEFILDGTAGDYLIKGNHLVTHYYNMYGDWSILRVSDDKLLMFNNKFEKYLVFEKQ